MPRYYFEAFREDGSEILGNCDGQRSIDVRDPARTAHFRRLCTGEDRPKWNNVSYWKLVDASGNVYAVINNPHYKVKK